MSTKPELVTRAAGSLPPPTPSGRPIWLALGAVGGATVIVAMIALLVSGFWAPRSPQSSATPGVAAGSPTPVPGSSSTPASTTSASPTAAAPTVTPTLGGIGGPDDPLDLTVHNPPVELTQCGNPAAGEPHFSLQGYDGDRLRFDGAPPYESAIGTYHIVVGWIELPAGASVQYRTEDGSARAGLDYEATTGTLTFSGDTYMSFPVPVLNDDTVEVAESFTIILSNPSPNTVKLLDCRMTLWIWDDDGPDVSIADVELVEGPPDYRVLELTAQLSEPTWRTFLLSFKCVSDGATQGEDFGCDSAGGGFFLFPVGQRTATSSIGIYGDDQPEALLEYVAIEAESPNQDYRDVDFSIVYANIVQNGLVTIFDDDGTSTPGPSGSPGSTPIPTFDPSHTCFEFFMPQQCTFNWPGDASVAIGDAQLVETDAFPYLELPLTLSAPLAQELQVLYMVTPQSASDITDYFTTGGSEFIPAGRASWTIRIQLNGDVLDEPNETFAVDINAPINVTRSAAIGTILDDDVPPGIVIDQPTASERDGRVRFVVALTAESGKTVRVTFKTVDGTAKAPADYAAVGVDATKPCPAPPSSTANYPCVILFPPGVTASAIDVPLVNDALAESSETLQVRLTDPRNATLDVAEGTATVTDDDGAPTGPVLVQETSPLVIFRKTWTAQSLAGASGGGVRYSSVLRAKAILAFTGRRIEILATRGPDRGKAAVIIDGVKVATVDLYAASVQPGVVVFSRDFATSGSHTIQLKVLAKKNTASSGKRIDLDAFRYWP